MLSEQEINCMKMCQNAPNCTDFSKFSLGSRSPDPVPALDTYSQNRCYGPEYKLELFSLVKVCQVHKRQR